MGDVDELICETHDYMYTRCPGILRVYIIYRVKANRKNSFVARAFFAFFIRFIFQANGLGMSLIKKMMPLKITDY